jgi:thiosulfate/3-mercaptopyruvate sulfurtransferase
MTMRYTTLKRSWLALLLLALVATTTACGTAVEQDDTRPEEEQNAEPAPLNTKVFVSAQELQQFADDGATIIDARSAEAYAAGHFPGAVNTHGGKAWKDSEGYLIEDVVEAQNKVRALGVDRERPVVIYGAKQSSGTARLFWTLEYYGHGQTHLYLSPYETLKAELEFTEQTEAPEVETGDFVIAERESVRATLDEVQAAIEGDNAILIDTRREAEHQGTEDRGDPRQGYIPEAVWYYWENVFDANGDLRPKGELETEFEEVGLLRDDAVLIPYCQTGTRSATLYAVYRWLGRDDAANYDGSWVEWSRALDMEIVQPQNETDGQ